MDFFSNFIKNLGVLLIIGIVLLFLFPGLMQQIYQLYGMLFGPFVFVMILVAALPRNRRRRR